MSAHDSGDQQPPIPVDGRLAGIDFGDLRIGIAITDPLRILASPLERYERRDAARDAEYFQQLVRRESIVAFIVGLPIHTSGQESDKSRQVRRFGAWLYEVTGCPIAYIDERYTTQQAKRMLSESGLSRERRKARRDTVAAQIILTSYLQSPQSLHQPLEGLDDN